MFKNKKILGILGLLSIVGILLMPYCQHSCLIIIPIFMCAIGGLSLGLLINLK